MKVVIGQIANPYEVNHCWITSYEKRSCIYNFQFLTSRVLWNCVALIDPSYWSDHDEAASPQMSHNRTPGVMSRNVRGNSGGECKASFVQYLAGSRVFYKHARPTNAILLGRPFYLQPVYLFVLHSFYHTTIFGIIANHNSRVWGGSMVPLAVAVQTSNRNLRWNGTHLTSSDT